MTTIFIHVGLEIEEAQKYWCECANALIKIENMLIKTNENECTSEKLEGKMPNYSNFLRTFGEIAIVNNSGLKIKGKLRDRGIQAMFVEYADNHAGNVYRFVNMKTKKIILSRDVTWLNKLYGDMYKQNDIAKKYNFEDIQNTDTFIEIETENEKPKSIPREIRNL